MAPGAGGEGVVGVGELDDGGVGKGGREDGADDGGKGGGDEE